MKSLLRRRIASLLKLSTPFAGTKKDLMSYIFEYLKKDLHNSSITSTLIDTRLSTIDGKLETKYPSGKTSYWVKDNKALESCKSKTLETTLKHQHNHHHCILFLFTKLQ